MKYDYCEDFHFAAIFGTSKMFWAILWPHCLPLSCIAKRYVGLGGFAVYNSKFAVNINTISFSFLPKGSFNNYVDRFLGYFDHPPTSSRQFIY